MIVKGEITDRHRQRLASLKHPRVIHVIPREGLTLPGMHNLKFSAKQFPQHRFLLVARQEWLDDSRRVALIWRELDHNAKNVHLDIVTGAVHGTEIGRRYARLAAGPAKNPVVESGSH